MKRKKQNRPRRKLSNLNSMRERAIHIHEKPNSLEIRRHGAVYNRPLKRIIVDKTDDPWQASIDWALAYATRCNLEDPLVYAHYMDGVIQQVYPA